MKPRLFIGCSVEHLDVGYALQENLEHDAEVTVWTQGVFDLSKYTLDQLLDLLEGFDFGVFVFAPDDVTKIRQTEHQTVRDNVVFEFGLFVGRLGKDRTFIVLPRGSEDLHLPTDLLGITPGLYEPQRADKNLVAALGPTANKIRRALKQLGEVHPTSQPLPVGPTIVGLSDENDILSLLESWLGSRTSAENRQALRFRDVDNQLNLAPDSAAKYLAPAALRWGYREIRRGPETVLFGDS